jgi:hypothetical protein
VVLSAASRRDRHVTRQRPTQRAQGNPTTAQLEWNALKQRVWQKEHELHPVLDVYLFARVYDGIFKAGQQI